MALLNRFQVCGLVESLLGVNKEFIGGFESHKLVALLIQHGNEVLSQNDRNNLGEENREVVEEAARNLGLSVEELLIGCCARHR